jgi:hypothetical protein
VFAAGRAGDQILGKTQVARERLLIAADVNAVPPSGIEGWRSTHLRRRAGRCARRRALAIGGIKYQTEFGLFQKMTTAAREYDFRDAFALARGAWIGRSWSSPASGRALAAWRIPPLVADFRRQRRDPPLALHARLDDELARGMPQARSTRRHLRGADCRM